MFAGIRRPRTVLAGSVLMLAGLYATVATDGGKAFSTAIAYVEQVSGEASLERDGTSERLKAGRAIARYDRLSTAANARLSLTFRDGSRLVLGENGAVTLEDWRAEQGRSPGVLLLELESGAARLTAAAPSKVLNRRVELRTPVAVIAVRDTDVWSGPIDTGTGIILLAGSISVRNDAGSVSLDRRHAGTIVRHRNSAPESPRGFNKEQIMKAMTTVAFPN
jgi:hypothetical protein